MTVGNLLKETFKQAKKHFLDFIIIYIPYALLVYAFAMLEIEILPILVSIVLLPALTLEFYDAIVEDRKARWSGVFSKFRKNIIITSILQYIYTGLWYFVFVIPGIIKSISYQRAIFLANTSPEVKASAAIKESQKEMYGRKGTYFLVNLIFAIPTFIAAIIVLMTILSGIVIIDIAQNDLYVTFNEDLFGSGMIFSLILLFAVASITNFLATIFRAVFNKEMDKIDPIDINF